MPKGQKPPDMLGTPTSGESITVGGGTNERVETIQADWAARTGK